MCPPPYTPVCIFIRLPVVKALRQSCGHRRRIPAHLGRFAMNIALILVLAGIAAIFLGIRRRKRRARDAADDAARYSGRTTMRVIELVREERDEWEDMPEGGSRRVTVVGHFPVFEYTVDGKRYTYKSRIDNGRHPVGSECTGYYIPGAPNVITEELTRTSWADGFLWFFLAAACFFFAGYIAYNSVSFLF